MWSTTSPYSLSFPMDGNRSLRRHSICLHLIPLQTIRLTLGPDRNSKMHTTSYGKRNELKRMKQNELIEVSYQMNHRSSVVRRSVGLRRAFRLPPAEGSLM